MQRNIAFTPPADAGQRRRRPSEAEDGPIDVEADPAPASEALAGPPLQKKRKESPGTRLRGRKISWKYTEGYGPQEFLESCASSFPWVDSSPDGFAILTTMVNTNRNDPTKPAGRTVRCKTCEKNFTLRHEEPTSSLKDHEGSKTHKEGGVTQRAAIAGASAQIQRNIFDADTLQAVAEDKMTPQGLTKLRQIVHAVLASYIPKSAISKIMSTEVLDLITILHSLSRNVGGTGTLDRDGSSALPMMKAAIAEKVKGLCGALVVDGATTHFLGGEKPVAVIFESSALQGPLLLGVILDAPDGKADTAAILIRNILQEYGIDLKTQIVQLIGDNVNWNDALAAALNVPRGKCFPHALSLVAKAGAKFFPEVELLTFGLSAVLNAGGSLTRKKSLKAFCKETAGFDIKIERLMTYENRFATALNALSYLLTPCAVMKNTDSVFYTELNAGVLHLVAQWLKTQLPLLKRKAGRQPVVAAPARGAAAPARGAAAAGGNAAAAARGAAAAGGNAAAAGGYAAAAAGNAAAAAGNAAAAAGNAAAAAGNAELINDVLPEDIVNPDELPADTSRLKSVCDAFNDPVAVHRAISYYCLLRKVPDLVTALSASGSSNNSAAEMMMKLTHLASELLNSYFNPDLVTAAVKDLANTALDPEEIIRANLASTVKVCALACRTQLMKHVPVDGISQVGIKSRLDPVQGFPPLTLAERASVCTIFGLLPEQAISCLTEYDRLRKNLYDPLDSIPFDSERILAAEVRTLVGEIPAPMARFWNDPGIMSMCPILSKIARFYTEVQLSSISAERAFGMMRAMEAPNRMSMHKGSFIAEMMYRANRWVSDELLKMGSSIARPVLDAMKNRVIQAQQGQLLAQAQAFTPLPRSASAASASAVSASAASASVGNAAIAVDDSDDDRYEYDYYDYFNRSPGDDDGYFDDYAE